MAKAGRLPGVPGAERVESLQWSWFGADTAPLVIRSEVGQVSGFYWPAWLGLAVEVVALPPSRCRLVMRRKGAEP